MSKPRQAEESQDQIFEVELEEAQNNKDERSLKQDENLIRDQVQQTNFTNIFCNKPPSRKMSYLIVLTSHFLVGVVQAYYSVIVMELQEKKATYDDQALFSIANYPYVIKIIFAPLVDVFFFSRIGRCKTWVVFGCFLLAAIFIYISPNADADINPHNVTSLTIQWIMISFVLIIIQISFKTWILKLFDEKEVGKMAYVTHIGGLFGGFFGMNIFVPLNSVPWLNRHLFTSHPVSSPILSHRTMQLIIAFFTIGLAVFVLLFVAEKVTEVGNHKMQTGAQDPPSSLHFPTHARLPHLLCRREDSPRTLREHCQPHAHRRGHAEDDPGECADGVVPGDGVCIAVHDEICSEGEDNEVGILAVPCAFFAVVV